MLRRIVIAALIGMIAVTGATAQTLTTTSPVIVDTTCSSKTLDKVAAVRFLIPNLDLSNPSLRIVAGYTLTLVLTLKNLCSGTISVPWQISRNGAFLGKGAVTINAGTTVNVSVRWVATAGSSHFTAAADPGNTLGEASLSTANNVPAPFDLTVYSYDPLVLDLNGDGVNTTGLADPVWFDLDGDGTKEHITWVNASTAEGFLWVNLSGKNRVDNGAELFGIGTLLPNGTRAQDGFQALAMYDAPALGGNGDGTIDTKDKVWESLRIWADANHNGVCEPSEVWPIARFGIEAIPLGAVATNVVDAQGNTHYLRAQYLRRVNGQLKSFAIDGIAFQRSE